MAKWLDRMINGGFLAIPVIIAVVIFMLSRLGCNATLIQNVESVIEEPAVLIQVQETSQPFIVWE